MKKILIVLWLFVLAMPALAQEAPKKPSDEEMLAYYIETARPVEQHQRLVDLAGDWNVTTKLWFDPAGQPKVATGKGKGKMILGGRFVSVETDLGGDLPSQALTIFGFDRRTNEYTLVGFDTLGTYYIDAAGKTEGGKVVLNGSYAQPPAGNLQKYRFVWTRSAGGELLTLYFDMAGKDVKVAETILTRPE
jgi:hypothetical protein